MAGMKRTRAKVGWFFGALVLWQGGGGSWQGGVRDSADHSAEHSGPTGHSGPTPVRDTAVRCWRPNLVRQGPAMQEQVVQLCPTSTRCAWYLVELLDTRTPRCTAKYAASGSTASPSSWITVWAGSTAGTCGTRGRCASGEARSDSGEHDQRPYVGQKTKNKVNRTPPK